MVKYEIIAVKFIADFEVLYIFHFDMIFDMINI